jgi:TusA-related sulfurtransferase
MIEIETTLDTSGLRCPIPILHTKRALAKMQVGELLRVITTDLSAPKDFDAMLQHTPHSLLGSVEQDARFEILIRKG